MKIYTDPRTGMKYADYMLSGRRHRRSLRTKNNQVAILKAARLADDMAARKTARLPLEAFLETYRARLQANLSANSLLCFKHAIDKLQHFCQPAYLQDITPTMLERLKLCLKEQAYSPSSINNYLALLKSMLYYAEQEGLLAPLPWKSVKKLRTPKGRVSFHTPAEIAAILALHPQDGGWQRLVLLGARAGLRAGEINRLTWQDIDLVRRQIYVAPGKTGRYRFVPIAQDLYNVLKSVPSPTAQDFVIASWHYPSDSTLCRVYCSTTKRLGFHCHLHKLRHTFASHLAQAGVDLYRISKLLGHSSIQMTEIYAHLSASDLPSAIDKLPPIG